jgi:hypothetical protein
MGRQREKEKRRMMREGGEVENRRGNVEKGKRRRMGCQLVFN